MTTIDAHVTGVHPLPDSHDDATHRTGGELRPIASDLRVLYVLKRFPRLSETFIVREVLGLEGVGATLGIDALMEPEPGLQHSDVLDVRASVRYLPRRPPWTREVVRAHISVGVRHPARWIRRALVARRRGEWRRFVQAGMVADRARREGFRHIHAHFATAASEVARDAAALAGISYSVTAHAKDIFHVDNADRLPDRVGEAATVITVSDYNVRHLRDRLDGAQVRYVPNGLTLPRPVPGQPDGPVLCVARLVPKKGVDVLIRAIAATRGDRPVEIVGDGSCRLELERLAADLGVADRVIFRGALASAEVDEAYGRCAVVVLPCRIDPSGDRDGMPTVLIEAMARAIPVISTDVVGLDELITHGRDGVLVPPDDPAALAAAIDVVLDDPGRATEMGRAARRRVAGEFAAPIATASLVEVLREAVAS